jgi:hypothetical protein
MMSQRFLHLPLSLSACCLALSLSCLPVFAAPLVPKEVKASSATPDENGVSYAGAMVADGKLATQWKEGMPSAGLGEIVEFQFGEEVTLTRFEIYGGSWESREFFGRYNRVKSVQLKFTSGAPVTFDLADKMEGQSFTFAQPVKTRSVKLILKATYPGNTFNDTVISEVRFFDASRGAVVDGVKAKAVTALKADADANYVAQNLFDGMTDTVWCEGRPDNGVGEVLTLTLPQAGDVTALRILNGVAASEETYKKNNRVTRLKVEAGGVSKELTIADKFGEWETLPLEGIKGTSLKLTVLDVAKGTSFNDTCVSEIQLVPAP